MQNVFAHEIEAAYMRSRVQDAAAASGLAAQATPRRTRNRRPIFPSLVLACLRAREVFKQQRVPRPFPAGRELPAA